MNRKILALILALAAVAVAVVLAVAMTDEVPAGTTPETSPNAGVGETAPSVPGVADSIFDLETEEPTEPEETDAPKPTEPANTRPEDSADPGPGLQDPDADAPVDTRPPQTEPSSTEPTKPTEPSSTEPTKPTEPAQTEPMELPDGEIDYEAFIAMTPAQQRAYMESFESIDAFFAWYNAAKEAYEKDHPAIDVGDGVIDLEDITG